MQLRWNFEDDELMRRPGIAAQIVGAIVSALSVAALPVGAYGQDSDDASYLCMREMAAGLAYNNSLKKWEGAPLHSEGSFNRFTLRMRFLHDRVRRNTSGEEEDVTDYEVTITEAETNYGFPCTSGGGVVLGRIVTVGDDDALECSANGYGFRFNLESNRFISVFLRGYLDGIDSGENAPMLSGGTCTKIDD
jgi:hypothetical protein